MAPNCARSAKFSLEPDSETRREARSEKERLENKREGKNDLVLKEGQRLRKLVRPARLELATF